MDGVSQTSNQDNQRCRCDTSRVASETTLTKGRNKLDAFGRKVFKLGLFQVRMCLNQYGSVKSYLYVPSIDVGCHAVFVDLIFLQDAENSRIC